MSVNKDVKVKLALAMLSLGFLSAFFSLSTSHWYDGNSNYYYGGSKITSRQHTGLWQTCTYTSIDLDGQAFKFFKCIPVYDPKSMVEYTESMMKVFGELWQTTGNDRVKRLVDRNIAEEADELMQTIRDAMYPDYLKAIQALEILANIFGLVSVVVFCITFVFMPSRVRNTADRSGMRSLVIGCTLAAGFLHIISIIVWVAEKEKEKTKQLAFIGAIEELQGLKTFYSWSFGLACVSGILHFLSFAPLVMTKVTTPDDDMELSLSPRA